MSAARPPDAALERLAQLHATFRAALIPMRDSATGDGLTALLPEGRRLKQRTSGSAVSEYLIGLAALAAEYLDAGLALPPGLRAEAAALEIQGAVQLPKNLALPPLDFRHCLFTADLVLANTNCHGWFDFDHADFLGSADFGGNHFLYGANFRRTVFCQRANFEQCLANAPYQVNFSHATFVGDADFEGAICRDFDFHGAKFLAGQDFD